MRLQRIKDGRIGDAVNGKDAGPPMMRTSECFGSVYSKSKVVPCPETVLRASLYGQFQ